MIVCYFSFIFRCLVVGLLLGSILAPFWLPVGEGLGLKNRKKSLLDWVWKLVCFKIGMKILRYARRMLTASQNRGLDPPEGHSKECPKTREPGFQGLEDWLLRLWHALGPLARRFFLYYDAGNLMENSRLTSSFIEHFFGFLYMKRPSAPKAPFRNKK